MEGRFPVNAPIDLGAACRLVQVFFRSESEKEKPVHNVYWFFSWCRKAIQIRTISLGCNFCRFSKGDGLCHFFIVKGNENLILAETLEEAEKTA